MAYSNRPKDYTKFPPLLDLLWPARSPLIWVAQYLSELLSGDAPRLRIIWAWSGCDSFAQWQEDNPRHAFFLRELILLALALVKRRQLDKLLRLPWAIFAIGDIRRSFEERVGLANRFKGYRTCCVPFGMARDLLNDEAVTVSVLTGRRFSLKLFFAAWEILLSLSIVEKLHARSRRCSDSQFGWHTFASNFVNRDLKEQHDHRCDVERTYETIDAVNPDTAYEAPGGPESETVLPTCRMSRGHIAAQQAQAKASVKKKGQRHTRNLTPVVARLREFKKAQSPLELFRREWIKLEESQGRHANFCTKVSWAACKQAFACISEAKRRSFQTQSQASRGLAEYRRRALKDAASLGVRQPPPLADASPPADDPPAAAALESSKLIALPRRFRPTPVNECFTNPSAGLGNADLPGTGADFLGALISPAKPTPASNEDERVPFSGRLMRKFFSKEGLFGVQGCGINPASHKFTRISKTISVGTPFPKKVTYECHCGRLCKTKHPPRLINMQNCMISDLDKQCKQSSLSGSAAGIGAKNIVLQFDSFVNEQCVKRLFVALVTASSAWFRYAANQEYARFDLVDEDLDVRVLEEEAFAGLVLEHARMDYIQPICTPPAPLNTATRGLVIVDDADALTSNLILLENSSEDQEPVYADAVACVPRTYRLLNGGMDFIEIIGVDEDEDAFRAIWELKDFDDGPSGKQKEPKRRRDDHGDNDGGDYLFERPVFKIKPKMLPSFREKRSSGPGPRSMLVDTDDGFSPATGVVDAVLEEVTRSGLIVDAMADELARNMVDARDAETRDEADADAHEDEEDDILFNHPAFKPVHAPAPVPARVSASVTPDAVLKQLRLRREGDIVFDMDAPAGQLGRLGVIAVLSSCSGMSLTAKCAMHAKCSFWVSTSTTQPGRSFDRVLVEVYRFLGAGRRMTDAQHACENARVKRDVFGIKPRS